MDNERHNFIAQLLHFLCRNKEEKGFKVPSQVVKDGPPAGTEVINYEKDGWTYFRLITVEDGVGLGRELHEIQLEAQQSCMSAQAAFVEECSLPTDEDDFPEINRQGQALERYEARVAAREKGLPS